MHDLSFFLLKNWLPVGVSAIVFFSIGLLLAKFIWGRFNQRLANAVEENINLAGQWSALGAAQQDLFKKIRVRWQADRDAWEGVIAEKDARIEVLSRQLSASGKEVPEAVIEDAAAKARIRELEASLAARTADLERLKESGVPAGDGKDQAKSPKPHFSPPLFELQARLRDLEQDLIDTHDELHKVRSDYTKQLELVESLESRLIEASGKEAVSAPSEPESRELAQFTALLEQRVREVRSLRESVRAADRSAEDESRLAAEKEVLVTRLAELEKELEEGREARARLEEEMRSKETSLEQLEEERKAGGETLARLENDLKAKNGELSRLEEDVKAKNGELSRLENEVKARDGELAAAKEKLAELDFLRRRKSSLQAELNDACHELYDVRRAFNQRADQVVALEARQAELAEERASLERLLEAARVNYEEVANRFDALAKSHELVRQEKAALEKKFEAVRRDLSETRLSLQGTMAEHQRAVGQMEELEAVIEDRGAEVNDLSAEVRQQRDLVRQLRETLAASRGEMEALAEESRLLSGAARAREAFGEEQRIRIGHLEVALSERYREMNRIRMEAEEFAIKARHFESRAVQLEDELVRRGAEFDASDRRIADVEQALEASQARIAALSESLEVSESSLVLLRDELAVVSKEKDETLRELDRTNRRIGELEEAARKREVELVEIERDAAEHRSSAASLELKVERLTLELENAREEQRHAQIAVTEMEQALRAGDERILELSARLDEKEAEAAGLNAEVAGLRELADTRFASEAEARIRLSTLEAELESMRRLDVSEEERAAHARELGALQDQVRELSARISAEVAHRAANLSEIETLRAKIAARSEMIRDLQNQISGLMLQRESRDTEIAMLKDKLRAVEVDLAKVRNAGDLAGIVNLSEAKPLPEEALVAAVEHSLAGFEDEVAGIPLEAMDEKVTHHEPGRTAVERVEDEAAPVAPSLTSADEQTVYFPENGATLSETEAEKVDLFARSVRRLGKKVEVTVIGFSGAEGSADFREVLSARRAEAVRERLLEKGVSQAVLKIRGAGQDRRFTDARARRVELVVSPVAVAETVN